MLLVRLDLMVDYHNHSPCRLVAIIFRESTKLKFKIVRTAQELIHIYFQVMDSKTHFTVANTTNMRRAAFTVTGLLPGTGYIVSIASSNSKGKAACL